MFVECIIKISQRICFKEIWSFRKFRLNSVFHGNGRRNSVSAENGNRIPFPYSTKTKDGIPTEIPRNFFFISGNGISAEMLFDSCKNPTGKTPDCKFAWSTVNALPSFISSLSLYVFYIVGFIYIAAIVFVIYVYVSILHVIWQRSTKIYNLEFHQVH